MADKVPVVSNYSRRLSDEERMSAPIATLFDLHRQLHSAWRTAHPHSTAHVVRTEVSEYWAANMDKKTPSTRAIIEKKIIELKGNLVLPKGQRTLNNMWERQETKNAMAKLGQNAKKDDKSLTSANRLNASSPITITIDDDDADEIKSVTEPLVVLEVVVLENQMDCPLRGSTNESDSVGDEKVNNQSIVCESGNQGEQVATSYQDITTSDKKADIDTPEINMDPQNEGCLIRIRNIESLMEDPQNEDCIVLE